MIFLRFSKSVQEYFGYPEIVCRPQLARSSLGLGDPLASIKYKERSDAHEIFEFIDGKTVYHKNRYNTNYQYTSEEQLVLRLGGVVQSPTNDVGI